jgi:hypothetical protein
MDLAGQLGVDFLIGVGVCCVSFQITVLKVLAGSPDGRLPLADLRHDVALLISSGPDWTDQTKRMAARAPGLDIFSQKLVLREPTGWQITAAGLELVASIEKPVPPVARPIENVRMVADPLVTTAEPPLPLIGLNMRRQRRRRRRARAGRPVAA